MSEKSYCVYEHVFPNGKRYIGISCDVLHRWRNGKGYSHQPKMQRAIAAYGWENIEHNVLIDGLTKAQATTLEKVMIQVFDSISNGYNVSIGGQEPIGTYLRPEVLSMICAAKHYFGDHFDESLASLADKDRKDETASGYWNEAYRAVIGKHRLYSPSNRIDVGEFWYYIGQYTDLYCKMQDGKDVSGWVEIPIEEAKRDLIFGKR